MEQSRIVEVDQVSWSRFYFIWFSNTNLLLFFINQFKKNDLNKDNISYTSEDNLYEEKVIEKKIPHQLGFTLCDLICLPVFKSFFDMSGFSDYNQLLNKPMNTLILLNYILSNENETPNNLVKNVFKINWNN